MTTWSNEKILKFIDAVRIRPELWDTECPGYKDRHNKRDCWNDIGKGFEITGDDAYRRFKNLRTYIKNAHRRGSKTEKWFAYDAMKFVLAGDVVENYLENENTTNENSTSEQPETEDFHFQFSTKSPQNKLLLPRTTRRPPEPTTDPLYQSNRKRPYRNSGFLEHIANKLSAYDQYTRSNVEFQISKILYEADMGMLRGQRDLYLDNYSDAASPGSVKDNITSSETTFGAAGKATGCSAGTSSLCAVEIIKSEHLDENYLSD